MGGVVNLAVRFSNNETFCYSVWTNCLPFYVNSYETLMADETVMREYFEEIKNSNDDYYDKPSRLCNSEYGLVVVDFVTKQIIDNNHYTTFGKSSAIYYCSSDDHKTNILKFFDENRVRTFKREFIDNKLQLTAVKDFTKEDCYKLTYNDFYEFNYDCEMTVVNFENDKADTKHMRDYLKSIGFPMTDLNKK